jgi:hypothetical protein
MPHLPASNRNSSQRLNWLSYQLLLHFTQLNRTANFSHLLKFFTDRTENTLIHCCISTLAMGTCLFAKPLLYNGSCIFYYLVVVAQQRVYMLQYSLATETVVNNPQWRTNKCLKQDNIISEHFSSFSITGMVKYFGICTVVIVLFKTDSLQ